MKRGILLWAVMFLALLVPQQGNADEVRVLGNWSPAVQDGLEFRVHDISIVEMRGVKCLSAVVEQRERMDDHRIWAFNPELDAGNEWVWHRSYGPEAVTRLVDDDGVEKIVVFGSGRSTPPIVTLDVQTDVILNYMNDYVIRPTGAENPKDDWIVTFGYTILDGGKFQAQAWRGADFKEDKFARSVTVRYDDAGINRFDPEGLFVDPVNKLGYALGEFVSQGEPDIVFVDFKPRTPIVKFRTLNMPRQRGNVEIGKNGFAYAASYGSNPGIWVFNTNGSEDPADWVLAQRYEPDHIDGWDGIYWLDLHGNTMYYAHNHAVGTATVGPDGRLSDGDVWDLEPLGLHMVSDSRIIYEPVFNNIYFNAAPEGQVYSRCTMGIFLD